MEIWVRSQDRKIFSNVRDVRFCRMKKCELKEEPHTLSEFVESEYAYCIKCNGAFLGEYPTKDRCLEIIDEIQGLFYYTAEKIIVYEMPKE